VKKSLSLSKLSFQDLVDLAHAVSRLPNLQRFSDSMTKYLSNLDWSSSVESVPTPPKSNYDKIVVIAAIIAGLGTFLSDTFRQGFMSAALSPNILLVLLIGLPAYFSVIMLQRLARAYVVPTELFKYRTGLIRGG
jgi:hypothetical protein